MKLTIKALTKMIQEEVVAIKEVFGRPEMVDAMLSGMDCQELQGYKQALSDPEYGPVPEDAPIWARIEVAIVEKCSDQTALPEAEEPPLATYQSSSAWKDKKKKPRPKDVPGDALTPADKPKYSPPVAGSKMANRMRQKTYRHPLKPLKQEAKNRKITQEQLKQMIQEEYRKYMEAWDTVKKGMDLRDRGPQGIRPGDTLTIFAGMAGKQQEFQIQHDEGGTELLYIEKDGKTIFISPEGNSGRIRRLQRQPDGSMIDLLPGMAPVLDPGQEQKLIQVQ